jgi:homoserine kinase
MTEDFEKIIIRVPASTANVGSGFDSIGIAFGLYTTLEIEPAVQTEFIWKGAALASNTISEEDNLVLKGLEKVYALTQQERPQLRVIVNSDIPLTRGLGSSSAAFVAGLVAANELLRKPYTDEDLLWLATEEEGHPDNVGASIFGGVFIASVDWEKKKVHYHHQAFPEEWQWLAAIPSYTLSTSVARQLLPQHYSKKDTVFNVSRYGLFVASLLSRNKVGVAAGLDDNLHQPYRQHLIPGFRELVLQKDDLGAIGFVISGAGPTVLCLVDQGADQETIMLHMKEQMAVRDHTIEVKRLAVENFGYFVQKIRSKHSLLSEK